MILLQCTLYRTQNVLVEQASFSTLQISTVINIITVNFRLFCYCKMWVNWTLYVILYDTHIYWRFTGWLTLELYCVFGIKMSVCKYKTKSRYEFCLHWIAVYRCLKYIPCYFKMSFEYFQWKKLYDRYP